MTTLEQTQQVVVATLDDLPLGEGRAYDVAGKQVAVFRLRSGRLYALDAVCSHAGGPIADGQVDETIVICPLHLNVFELATGCSRSDQPDLRSYPVTVDEDGRVAVAIPAREVEAD
jgi:nitrite reductase/ring-hydroxylating ferredoxin subunit